MSLFQDRRALAGIGAVAAVVLAVGAALFLSRSPKPDEAGSATPVESSNITGSTAGGLKVEMGKAPKVESDTSVRCFVKGQFVGMQTAADCAQKNGVAPGALDVGLDQSGAIAAGGGDTRLAPLADANAVADARSDKSDDSDDAAATTDASADPTEPGPRSYADAAPAQCRRYVAGGWRPAGDGVGLDACVHTLFDGRCPPPGQVIYGHWGGLTLRSSPGRIDVSQNNRDFRPLAPQYPADCSIPPL
jgi:hypothetical protein